MSNGIGRHRQAPGRTLSLRSAFSRTALGAFGAALWLFASTAPASAGLPTHSPKPGLDIGGFNHACGTAVDSKGDVYVASAGESKIRVFSPAHVELTSVEDTHTPCGLAIDTNGNLYVSNQAPHEIVKYHPSAYPPTGSTTYGSTTVDANAGVRGIAVDPADNRLYVAEGSRISTYDSEGTLGIDEVQRVLPFEATGGTYRLIFGGQETTPLPLEATHAEVQAALEGLSTIGAGNVSVTQGPNPTPSDHLVTFKGKLGSTAVETLTANTSGLTGVGATPIFIAESTKGFSGHIGEGGSLTNATGVAAYTYKVHSAESDRYVFAADAATNQVKVFGGADIRNLKLRHTIAGPKPGEPFGFGLAGAYLAVDPGNGNAEGKCTPVAEQACTAGHLLVYDDAHKALDEFETGGEYEHLDQVELSEAEPGFADAEPTAIAVDRSGGPNDGVIYVTAGPGPGAKLLAYGPLAAPSRTPLAEPFSHVLAAARAVATDSRGDVYVAAGAEVRVYGQAGNELTKFEDPGKPSGLAVDSTGKVYVLDFGNGFSSEAKVTYYTPSAYPPSPVTTYARHEPPLLTSANFGTVNNTPTAIAVNPSNDHLFATSGGATLELASAASESTILNSHFGSDLGLSINSRAIGVYGANGDVYIDSNGTIDVINPAGTEVLARISGAGSPNGLFVDDPQIAVDQSNGHLLAFSNSNGSAQEFDSSGAFVAEFGVFTKGITRQFAIAIDNACALHDPPLTEATSPTCKEFDPANANVYVAFDDSAPNTFDLTAFGPLAYGEPPAAVTGSAGGLGAGGATLGGTVDPRGSELEECRFEYTTEADFQANGFAGVETHDAPCLPGVAEIGHGAGPVAVHADVDLTDPESPYRFRLVAKNKYGESEGKAGLFGPPLITAKSALPVLYTEATLRAGVDPSGLATRYRFEYGTGEGEYSQSTPVAELPPGDGAVTVQAPLTGLAEGTEYHFRVVAENEAGTVRGLDRNLVTLKRAAPQSCPNAEYRTGLSANLPDCRAYELVTPAETNGAIITAPFRGGPSAGFNNWLTSPRGSAAGEALTFTTSSTLPGFEGSGAGDGYRTQRGAGAHPSAGWSTEIVSPSYTQEGGNAGGAGALNGASDQLYSFWSVKPHFFFEGTFEEGVYLRTPAGFEVAGRGSLGTDLQATSQFVSPGGAHVIFSSKEHLEPEAAPQGTEAIYDRAAGSSSAQVISLKPDESAFGVGEAATYLGSTEDGSAVVFRVGGALYLHREGKTVEVATAPNAFAGISADGERVFYAAGASGSAPASLFVCDLETGPCAGAGAHAPTQIAPGSIFVNVSLDGSHVFFTSEQALTGGEENEAGEVAEPDEHNLYAWSDGGTRFIARLVSKDFESFDGGPFVSLLTWTEAVTAGTERGRGESPTRSTPDGEVFVFQSHAKLTSYENEGFGEIYRYSAAAAPGEQLVCVSCNPSAAPPSADAILEDLRASSGVDLKTLIPNVTDDGAEVFFQSPDRLLPEDANSVQDVYEWRAKGTGEPVCERPGGCLALISSGQGEHDNSLYSMSADGHDVFFRTLEKLVGTDATGSYSIYDARVEGGIPNSPEESPCQGDACQGEGSRPPILPAPASTGRGNGNAEPEPAASRCAKGRRPIKGRCAAKHHKRKSRHRRSHRRRASRNGGARR